MDAAPAGRREPQPPMTDAAAAILDLRPADVVVDPFPHVLKQQMLRPDFYARLEREFPADAVFDGRPTLIGARTGRDLFRGDRDFESFLDRAPAWREFHDYINSAAFLDLTLALFAPHFERFGCRVAPDRARLVEHTESRFGLWWQSAKARFLGLHSAADPGEIFVRFDIEQSNQGYSKPVHCDLPNRLVSLIVYFSDADEIGLDGGDLRIHQHRERKPPRDYERYPKAEATRVIQTLRPRRNLGMFFLCSNNSYHSVTAVDSIRDYRRFVYLNLSSRADSIW
jgi:hypothetical protein